MKEWNRKNIFVKDYEECVNFPRRMDKKNWKPIDISQCSFYVIIELTLLIICSFISESEFCALFLRIPS